MFNKPISGPVNPKVYAPNPVKKEPYEEKSLHKLLCDVLENLLILTKTVKEDMAYRLRTKFNAYDFQKTTATTTDQSFTFSEPLTSFVVAIPDFGTATKVYIALETASGAHTWELTASLPMLNVTDLVVRRFSYSTNTGTATIQMLGLRGE